MRIRLRTVVRTAVGGVAAVVVLGLLATQIILPTFFAIGAVTHDDAADLTVPYPAFASRRPKLMLDRGHFNVRTPVGQSIQAAFAQLASNDGYEVVPYDGPLGADALRGVEVLVIAMAAGGENYEQAADDAFDANERRTVVAWVRSGGSLLLAFDHYPNDSAISALAADLGVRVGEGIAIDSSFSRVPWNCFLVCRGWIGFERDDGRLRPHAILEGRSAAERVSDVVTFGGSSLTTSDPSGEFIVLSPTAVNEQNSPGDRPAGAVGRAQAAALSVGAGRLVAFADSNLIGTQFLPLGRKGVRMGLAVADNRQVLLNSLHWLSRVIG